MTAKPEPGFSNAAAPAPPSTPACENCGGARPERYCAACGQNDRNYVRGLLSVIWEFFRESFEVDSRLFRTLKLLFFRPGSLSNEFCRNRRARYMSPVRLYLFSSFLFFLVLSLSLPDSMGEDSLLADTGDTDGQVGVARPSDADLAALRAKLGPGRQRKLDDILNRPDGEYGKSAAMTVAGLIGPGDVMNPGPGNLGGRLGADSLSGDPVGAQTQDSGRAGPDAAREVDRPDFLVDRPGFFARMFLNSVVDFLHDRDVFVQRFIGNMPIAMFFMLPFCAVALALCYIRKKRYFVEHFVFGMHIQAFSFLVLGATLLTPAGAVGNWIRLLLVLVPQLYYLVALRRFYRDGWIRTLIKGVFVWWLYFAALFPGFLVALYLTS